MSDLTTAEQARVRTALRFLRTRAGGWGPLAKALHAQEPSVRHAAADRPVTASLAFRVARLARVGVDDLLAGRFPDPRACPHCGHVAPAEAPPEAAPVGP